jgi:hypothetical protein
VGPQNSLAAYRKPAGDKKSDELQHIRRVHRKTREPRGENQPLKDEFRRLRKTASASAQSAGNFCGIRAPLAVAQTIQRLLNNSTSLTSKLNAKRYVRCCLELGTAPIPKGIAREEIAS